MFEAAIGTALFFILPMIFWGNLRRIAGFGPLFDIGITLTLMWLFAGTYAGVVTGMIAGSIITLFLKGVRKTLGYEVPRFHRRRGQLLPRLRWEHAR